MPDLESWRQYQDMPQVEAKSKCVLYTAAGIPLVREVGFQGPASPEPDRPAPTEGPTLHA